MNLLDGYNESLRLYEGALNSAGTTQQKYNLWMEGTEAHMNRLKATSEEVWLKVFNSKDIQQTIDAVTHLVSALGWLIDTFGALPSFVGLAMLPLMKFKTNLKAFSVDFKKVEVGKGFFDNLGNVFKDAKGFGISAFKGLTGAIQSAFNGIKSFGEGLKSHNKIQQNTATSTQNTTNAVKASTMAINLQKGAFLALRGVMMIVNTAVGMLASVIISKLVEGLIKWINGAKEARDATNELLDVFKHNTKENNDNIQSLIALSDEYAKLTSKSNLTADEQERLYSIQNQIADISPELVTGYDKQGRAMLELNNGIQGVVESLREKNELENSKMVAGGNDAFKAYKDSADELTEKMQELNEKRDQLLYGSKNNDLSDDKTIGLTANGLKDLERLYAQTNDINIAKLIENQRNELKRLDAEYDVYVSKLQGAKNNLMPFTQAILNSTSAYNDLTPAMQRIVQEQMKLLKFEDYKNYDQLASAITRVIVETNRPEMTEGLTKLNGFKDAFDKGKISSDEFRKSTFDTLSGMVTFLNSANPNLGLTVELLAKFAKINLSTPVEQMRTYEDSIKDVMDSVESYGKEVANANTILEKHKETNEWDFKAIMELVNNGHPQLLSALSDESLLEQELIGIKEKRIKQTQTSIQGDMDALLAYIKNAVGVYEKDASNFKTAMEAKQYYSEQFFKGMNENLDVIEDRFRGLAQDTNELDDETAYTLGKKARLMAHTGNTAYQGHIDGKIDEYFGLKNLSDNVEKLFTGVSTSPYDGKNSSNKQDYNSDIKSLTTFTSVIDEQNDKLKIQDNILGDIANKITEKSNDKDYTETVKLQNQLLDEQNKKQTLLNETKSKYTLSKDKVKQAFLDNDWLQGVDIESLTKADMDKIYDKLFSGNKNFGTGDLAKESKEAFEASSNLFKSLSDDYFKLNDAITDVDKNINKLNSDIEDTNKDIKKTATDLLNEYIKSMQTIDEMTLEQKQKDEEKDLSKSIYGVSKEEWDRNRDSLITSLNEDISDIQEQLKDDPSNTTLLDQLKAKEISLDEVMSNTYENITDWKEAYDYLHQSRIDAIDAEIDALENQQKLDKQEEERLERKNELLKLQNELQKIKENRNIQVLKKQEDGTWQYEYIYDVELAKKKQEEIKKQKEENRKWEEETSTENQIRLLNLEKKTLNELDKALETSYNKQLKALKAKHKEEDVALKLHYADIDKLVTQSLSGLVKTYEGKWSEIVRVITEKVTEAKNKVAELQNVQEKTGEIDVIKNPITPLPTSDDSQTYLKASEDEIRAITNGDMEHDSEVLKEYFRTHKFANGGMNKTSGWYWLDGTASSPELVLKPEDTKNLLNAIKLNNKSTNVMSGLLNALNLSYFNKFSLPNNNNSLSISNLHLTLPNVSNIDDFIEGLRELPYLAKVH